jgi:hypothetical protein
MILRYHRHNMSSIVEKDAKEEELATANSRNTNLAARVHNLFCESWECVDGYRGGGEFKLDKILLHDIPIEGPKSDDPDGPATPLALLLQRLYRILNVHYHAVDFEELKKYAAERLNPPQPTTQQPVEQPYKLQKYNLRAQSGIDREHYKKLMCLEANGEPETISQASKDPHHIEPYRRIARLPSTPDPARRVLDNHSFIIQAFHEVFEDDDGNEQDLSATIHDRFVDQFIGLQAMLGVAPKKPSTKRPRSDATDDDTVISTKRFCTRLEFGQCFILDPTLGVIIEEAGEDG